MSDQKASNFRRASLNNIISKSKTIEVSKTDFLLALGVPGIVTEKLLKLEEIGIVCVGVYNVCNQQCIGNTKKQEGIKVAQINKWIEQGILKEADFNKDFIARIRQK